MKVLFILPEFFPVTGGGICTYYNQLLSLFKTNSNWELTVLQGSAFDARGGEESSLDYPVYYLDHHDLASQKEKFLHLNIFPELQTHIAAAWAMYKKAQTLKFKFDVVVTTDWGLGFIPWLLNNQIPTIVHLHGSIGQIDHYEPRKGLELLAQTYLNIEKDLLNKATALVTHSKQNVNFWAEQGISKEKIHLIPPPILAVSPSIKDKKPTTQILGLVIGRIQFWKGPISLCEAIRLLSKEEKTRLKIYWIGRDTYYSEANLSMEHFLTKEYPDVWGNIILPIGPKTHEEITSYYNEIDFGLVPSTWDMFNLTTIEHLLHKKALICSCGAGASDFLIDSPGVIVYDNTISDLARALKKLIVMRNEDLVAMGQKNAVFAKECFNNQTTLNTHVQVIEEAVKNFVPISANPNYNWLYSQNKTTDARAALMANWPSREIIKFLLKKFKSKLHFKR